MENKSMNDLFKLEESFENLSYINESVEKIEKNQFVRRFILKMKNFAMLKPKKLSIKFKNLSKIIFSVFFFSKNFQSI